MVAQSTPTWQVYLARENQIWDAAWELLGAEAGWGAKPTGPWDVECQARCGVRFEALRRLHGSVGPLQQLELVGLLDPSTQRWTPQQTEGWTMEQGLAARLWELAVEVARVGAL